MGTLPVSRTITINTGDPIPSTLINELQDVEIAIGKLISGQAQGVFAGGIILVTNHSLVVSGTGDVKHGDREVVFSAPAFNNAGGNTAGVPGLGDDWAGFSTPPNDTIRAAVTGLRAGDRIKSLVWHFNKASNASLLTMKLRTRNGTTNTDRDTLSDASSGAAYTSASRLTINYTLVTGDAAMFTVQSGAGGGSPHRFSHVIVTYDHP